MYIIANIKITDINPKTNKEVYDIIHQPSYTVHIAPIQSCLGRVCSGACFGTFTSDYFDVDLYAGRPGHIKLKEKMSYDMGMKFFEEFREAVGPENCDYKGKNNKARIKNLEDIRRLYHFEVVDDVDKNNINRACDEWLEYRRIDCENSKLK